MTIDSMLKIVFNGPTKIERKLGTRERERSVQRELRNQLQRVNLFYFPYFNN